MAQKKSYPRSHRVAEAVRAAVSPALLADPGARFVTVREVRVSRDCGRADILYSLLGENDGAQAALDELAPRLRRALAATLRMRATPNLRFIFDSQGIAADRLRTSLEKVEDAPPAPSAAPAAPVAPD